MPNSTIQPYLFFGGRCEEALEFYGKALGAKVEMLMRYNESPEPAPPGMLAEGYENKVMHATFQIGENTLMASDGCGPGEGFHGFHLSIAVKTNAEAEKAFNALAEGGEVDMPLAKTFWSPYFGMLTDRFGLGWMISVVP
ncbi:MAG: VOC family protein [Chthoniobacterales bacterium]